MRKIYLFLLLTLLVEYSVFSQHDEDGITTTNNELKQLKSDKVVEKVNTIPGFSVKYDSIRALFEINSNNIAETYPWISSDGCRLYYTKSNISTPNRIYFASRLSAKDTFNYNFPLEIEPYNSESSFSCWLTNDELNIYFTSWLGGNCNLYHSSRISKTDNFNTPNRITLLGNSYEIIIAPSLTPDLSQLFIMNIKNNLNSIYIFKKTGYEEYTINDSLNIPEGFNVGPGTLADNGLKFYIGLKSLNNYLIYCYTRNNILEKFNDIFYLDNNKINDTLYRNHQPFISNSGNFFVFVRDTLSKWSNNDLFIAYNNEKYNYKKNQAILLATSNIFPNPSSNIITINLDNYIDEGLEYISIINSNGMLVEGHTINRETKQITISTNNYHNGAYVYFIKTINRNIYGGKFIVNNY